MYPWVCGRCAREFSGKRLSELTVHHKDHNHDNNPEDGSNWELLCLYFHDNENSRYTDTQSQAEARTSSDLAPKETFTAFTNLDHPHTGKQDGTARPTFIPLNQDHRDQNIMEQQLH